MKRTLLVLGILFVARPARADLYVDLVTGDATTQSTAVLEILKHAADHSGGLVRRALYVSTRVPNTKTLPHIANVLKNTALDVATRTAAALTLGTIGKEHPDLWPPGAGDPPVQHPLPVFAKNALMDCVQPGNPSVLRSACAEALGVAKVTEATSMLTPLIDAPDEDPFVRVFAGRAVTMITGVPSVSDDSLHALTTFVIHMVIP